MIKNIWAVGRNYRDHAKELGNEVPKEPIIFLKAGSTACFEKEITLPRHSQDVHHEIEVALRFGRDLQFNGFALALDLTARDLQQTLKSAGLPWTLAKSFKQSCPLSKTHDFVGKVPHFEFQLSVNGEIRQKGTTEDMIFDFEALRKFVIERFPVETGDYLLTGTPSGVSQVKSGDQLTARLFLQKDNPLSVDWVIK